jgi:hypothetical protein
MQRVQSGKGVFVCGIAHRQRGSTAKTIGSAPALADPQEIGPKLPGRSAPLNRRVVLAEMPLPQRLVGVVRLVSVGVSPRYRAHEQVMEPGPG